MSKTYLPQKVVSGFKSWIPLIIIIAAILLLGMVVGQKAKSVEEAKKKAISENEVAINVVTLKLSPKTIRDKLNLPGVVEPWFQVYVAAEVAGRVVDKSIKEGSRVEAGDIIARIDPAKYLNAYNAAKASYESAIASKKRLSKLYTSKLSNKSDLDAITAQAANAEASMKVAALDLEKCNVRAPVSGTVNRIMIEKGQFLDTGNAVAQLIQIDKVKVTVGIPESDVTDIRGVKRFKVSFKGLDGKVFEGTKHYLSKTTSTLARLYDLEVAIDNPEIEILPGMFGRVEIVKRQSEGALSVPLFSVLQKDGKKIVYTVAKNQQDIRAKARAVKTGLQEGWMVEITEGLMSGDEVVVSGQRTMSQDQKVKVIKTVTGQEELIQ